MKTLILLLKRIFENPFIFVMIIFQIAVVTVALVGIYNAYTLSHACIDSVSGGNRMIYRSRSSDFDSEDPVEYRKETDELMSDCKDYLGTSFIANGYTFLGENATLEMQRLYLLGEDIPEELIAKTKYEDYATTYYYDPLTLNSVQYPLISGSWENMLQKTDEMLPCVLGGWNAKNYKVGDKLNYYVFSQDGNSIHELNYTVVGIMPEPLFLLGASKGQTDKYKSMLLSEIYDTGINEPLVIVSNSDLASEYDVEMFFIRPNYLVYFNENTEDRLMEDYAVMLGDAYACTDKQMIASEEREITRNIDVIYPFVIIFFVISLSTVVSISVITLLDSMKVYTIYFLLGCTRRKILVISIFYSIVYIAMSGIMSIVIIKTVYQLLHGNFKHYFTFSPKIALPVLAAFMVTAIISIILQYVLQKKKTIKELVLKTPN